jgi:hypothetical protein
MTKQDWEDRVNKDKPIYDECKLKLFDAWQSANAGTIEEFNTILQKLFDIAFEEGQQYVWFMRSGFGKEQEETPYTITVTNGPQQSFVYKDGKLNPEN